MPGSKKQGKAWLTRLWQAAQPELGLAAILDIGPGSGTYARLLRQPGQRWTAIEVWGPYVDRYGLTALYDRVVVADARIVDWSRLGRFDLAFCGDVLEHMSKAEALDLVERLLACCRLVVISIPIKPMPQGSWEGNPFETHIKEDWSHAEALASFPALITAHEERPIGLYVLGRSAGDGAAVRKHESAIEQRAVKDLIPE